MDSLKDSETNRSIVCSNSSRQGEKNCHIEGVPDKLKSLVGQTRRGIIHHLLPNKKLAILEFNEFYMHFNGKLLVSETNNETGKSFATSLKKGDAVVVLICGWDETFEEFQLSRNGIDPQMQKKLESLAAAADGKKPPAAAVDGKNSPMDNPKDLPGSKTSRNGDIEPDAPAEAPPNSPKTGEVKETSDDFMGTSKKAGKVSSPSPVSKIDTRKSKTAFANQRLKAAEGHYTQNQVNIPEAISDGHFRCPDEISNSLNAVEFDATCSQAVTNYLCRTIPLTLQGKSPKKVEGSKSATLITYIEQNGLEPHTCATMRALVTVRNDHSAHHDNQTFLDAQTTKECFVANFNRVLWNLKIFYELKSAEYLHQLQAQKKRLLKEKAALEKENRRLSRIPTHSPRSSGSKNSQQSSLQSRLNSSLQSTRSPTSNRSPHQGSSQIGNTNPNESQRTCTQSSSSGSKKKQRSSGSKESPGSSGHKKKRASPQNGGSNKKPRSDGPPRDPPIP